MICLRNINLNKIFIMISLYVYVTKEKIIIYTQKPRAYPFYLNK